MENKLIDEIRRLINREEYEEAEKLSLNLLHSTESKHVFFSLLGDIYLAQGRSIEAQLFFERALESAPDYQPALHGLEEIDYLISLVRLPSSHIISKFNTGELHSDDFILLYRMIRETDRRIELIESLKHDLHVTEGNWETIWFFAQEARLYEQFEAVDIFCEKILTVRPGFGYARELPKHVRGYYAAHDLDVYIEQFFEHHPKHVKFFIDIGASDGLYHSQVRRLFESFNWQGICVEAEHDQYLRVRKLYENTPVQCFHSIVSDISTPIQDELGSEMKTVDAILEENGIAETDFISVNTGSQAMAVLRGINFSRCAPLLLSVKTGEDKAEIEEFLAREGYQVCMDAGTHVFFERHLRHLVNSFPKEEIKEEFVQLSRQKKIIGLLLVTEPSPYLEPALRTFSLFNDSIVILNTLEEDSVHSQLTALKDDCSIEGLYRGTFNSVMSAYNALLQYGREHRGTHFCMGDVFSIPSGNMLEQDLYRSSIIELEPGESLFLNKTFLWKN
ncbi:MAG: hypothetical protein LWX56_13960, partial [Ignavibacteria bacterium]|nr:hypothetical protein [Ignavibacteria bacterium]